MQFIPNPFPQSKLQEVRFHGNMVKGIKKFHRTPSGFWTTDLHSWAHNIYAQNGKGEVYALYLDVRNPYIPSDEENDDLYGDLSLCAKRFPELLAQGYDSYYQGGESESWAVFANVHIVNAVTGEAM